MPNLNSPNFPGNYPMRGLREPISITTVLIGAAIGGVSAAISGGNILKGALMGAVTGAIGSAIGGAAAGLGGLGEAAAGAVPEVAGVAGMGIEQTIATGGADAATSAAWQTGAGLGQDVVTAAVQPSAGMIGTNTLADVGGEAFTAAQPVAVQPVQVNPPMAPPTAGVQAPSADPFSAPTAPVAAQTPSSAAPTTIGQTNSSSGINQLSSDTSINSPQNIFRTSEINAQNAAGPGSASSSFLDELLNKGRGMINNKLVTDIGGQMLKGYTAGKNQEAQLNARQQEIDRARANARFGNTGSRYATGGMMNANLTYKG